MSEDLPLQGTILSSSPCTVKDAAALLRTFLQSDTVPESGLLRGYLDSVTSCLQELASRPPPKRKEKKSRKHREVVHQNTGVKDDVTTSGLNAEAVPSEAEQHNGSKKASGKKRKGHEDDKGDNEQYVKRKKHSKRKDFGDGIENDKNRVKKKIQKKREDDGVDGGDHEESAKKQLPYERNDGGDHLDNNDPGAKKKHRKKRKDRGPDVETDGAEIREKKRKKRL